MAQEEKRYFQHEGIIVTNTRFVSGSETFAMANISSVKTTMTPPSRGLPIILMLIGLIALAGSPVAGLAFLALGGLIFYVSKGRYHVVVNTNAGEVKALETTDASLAASVLQAINDAIIHRG